MNHISSSSFLWIWEIIEVKNIIDYYHSQNHLYSACNKKCFFCDSEINVYELNLEVKLSVSINFLKHPFFYSFSHDDLDPKRILIYYCHSDLFMQKVITLTLAIKLFIFLRNCLSHIMYPLILHIFHRFNFIYFCPSCFLLSCFHLVKLLAETPFCLAASTNQRWN